MINHWQFRRSHARFPITCLKVSASLLCHAICRLTVNEVHAAGTHRASHTRPLPMDEDYVVIQNASVSRAASSI